MERLLNPKEASVILNVSTYTLLYGSLKDEIPKVLVLPRKPKYRKEDIEKYINKKVQRLTSVK